MTCQEFELAFWLRAYGESPPGGDAGFAAHLSSCANCQARYVELEHSRELLHLRTAFQADPAALQRSRTLLQARLQVQPKRHDWGVFWERWRDVFTGGLAPKWQLAGAATLLICGLLLGRLLFFQSGVPITKSLSYAFDPSAAERHYISQSVLRGEPRLSDLRIKPVENEGGLVEVSFQAMNDFMIRGKPDEEPIRDLLAWALKNDDNSGVRLQSVAGLAQVSALNPQVRQALAYALINDQNDGVRLKALEALAKAPADELVEQALLRAVLDDPNPAIRIKAIDLLLKSGIKEKSQSYLLSAAEQDSNEYVRKRARQAMREAFQSESDAERESRPMAPGDEITGGKSQP